MRLSYDSLPTAADLPMHAACLTRPPREIRNHGLWSTPGSGTTLRSLVLALARAARASHSALAAARTSALRATLDRAIQSSSTMAHQCALVQRRSSICSVGARPPGGSIGGRFEPVTPGQAERGQGAPCCCFGFAFVGFGSRAGQGGDAEPGEGDGAVFDGVRHAPGIGKAENRGERGLSEVEGAEGDPVLAVRAVPGPQRLFEWQWVTDVLDDLPGHCRVGELAVEGDAQRPAQPAVAPDGHGGTVEEADH